MSFFKKYWVFVALGILGVLFFVLRFYNILSLPIFTDEAIYVRWAQIAKQDSNWRFISLTDGKQPSFIWFSIIALKFIKDPLLASRTVSVFAGFVTFIGMFFLGRELFRNAAVGLTAAFLFVLYPFALVYDRLAIYDATVAMFAVWGLYVLVLLTRKVRLDIALIAGMVLGGAVLTKTSGFLSIYLSPLLILLFDFSKKDLKNRFVRWTLLLLLTIIFTYIYYSILRLSPFFHIISQKNAIFVYPLSEWFEHPFRFVFGNLKGLFDWVITYMTVPVFLLSLVSFFVDKKLLREKVFLALWFFGPLLSLALFGRLLYPRFVYFMTIPLLLLAAYSLYHITLRFKRTYIRVGVVLLFTILMVRADISILANLSNAPIPVIDKEQYINGWPAGGGIKESVAFFEKESQKGKIFVGTQGTFGLMPYAYEIYLDKNPNIKTMGFWPLEHSLPKELVEAAKTMPTYVVFYQPCPVCEAPGVAPKELPLELISTYKKGRKEIHFNIYKVIPESNER